MTIGAMFAARSAGFDHLAVADDDDRRVRRIDVLLCHSRESAVVTRPMPAM